MPPTVGRVPAALQPAAGPTAESPRACRPRARYPGTQRPAPVPRAIHAGCPRHRPVPRWWACRSPDRVVGLWRQSLRPRQQAGGRGRRIATPAAAQAVIQPTRGSRYPAAPMTPDARDTGLPPGRLSDPVHVSPAAPASDLPVRFPVRVGRRRSAAACRARRADSSCLHRVSGDSHRCRRHWPPSPHRGRHGVAEPGRCRGPTRGQSPLPRRRRPRSPPGGSTAAEATPAPGGMAWPGVTKRLAVTIPRPGEGGALLWTRTCDDPR